MSSENDVKAAEAARKAEQARLEAERKRLEAEQDLKLWKLREEWGGNG